MNKLKKVLSSIEDNNIQGIFSCLKNMGEYTPSKWDELLSGVCIAIDTHVISDIKEKDIEKLKKNWNKIKAQAPDEFKNFNMNSPQEFIEEIKDLIVGSFDNYLPKTKMEVINTFNLISVKLTK